MNAPTTSGGRLLGPLIAASVAVLILAASILPFLTPGWVAFEQGRAQAAAWTGFSEPDLRMVSNSILGDLVLSRGDFAVELDGAPVLTPVERGHMRDVRGVFGGLAFLAAAAVAVILAGVRVSRTPDRRVRLWIAIRGGAVTLAGVVVVLGLVALIAFDAAFELFHRLFFAPGTYTFDPRTSRLVQLFPETFWMETAIAVGVLVVVLALAAAWLAGRRALRIGGALQDAMSAPTRSPDDISSRGHAAPSITNGGRP